MLWAAEMPLFSPGGRVTVTALKYSGTSDTVGSLVAATTVRRTAAGACGACAAADAASPITPSHSIAIVLNRMMASQFQRIHHRRSLSPLEWQAASSRWLAGMPEAGAPQQIHPRPCADAIPSRLGSGARNIFVQRSKQ